MSQIFKPSADTWLRLTVLGVFVAIFGIGLASSGLVNSSYLTRVGLVQSQPVPFSHQHHVAELGLDCRYCHTGVETGANAGFPSTHTCMTCHSQIWTNAELLAPVRKSLASDTPLQWKRVSVVPDYVYFDHSIHISRGVACVSCHGRVDQMPLTGRAKPFQMRFCLECHRNPAPAIRPPDQVTRMDWRGWDAVPAHEAYGAHAIERFKIDVKSLDNCEICHR